MDAKRRLCLRTFVENKQGDTLYDHAQDYDQQAKTERIDAKFGTDIALLQEGRKSTVEGLVKSLTTGASLKGF